MKTHKKFIINSLVILICIIQLKAQKSPEDSREVALRYLDSMFIRTKAIKTASFIMEMNERAKGKLNNKKAFFNINYSPLKFYYKQFYPNEGLEVLFVEGWNNNKALINTNSFPWLNISLDPKSSLVRQDHHHTLFESGFPYLSGIMEYLVNKDFGYETFIQYKGEIMYQGIKCYSIYLSNPLYKYTNYTVKEGETLSTIAHDQRLSDFMLLELNPRLKYYDSVKKGDIIKIPESYAKDMIMYIDPVLWMPRYVKVMDDKGVYEEFVISEIKINPKFDKEEFTVQCSGYNF